MSAGLAVLQMALELAAKARCLLVLQSYSWRWYWLLWHDVCWSYRLRWYWLLWHDGCRPCSLTDGAGIGFNGMMSACFAVLQVALVLAVVA